MMALSSCDSSMCRRQHEAFNPGHVPASAGGHNALMQQQQLQESAFQQVLSLRDPLGTPSKLALTASLTVAGACRDQER